MMVIVTFKVHDSVVGKPVWYEKEIFTSNDDAEIEDKIRDYITLHSGKDIKYRIEDIKRV